jgi:RecA-family ATPase
MMERALFKNAVAAPPPLDFVLPGLLAGSVGMIVSKGAVGKTYLALHIGIGIASGRPICPSDNLTHLWPAQPGGDVAIVMGEDPINIIKQRQHALINGLGLDAAAIELLDEKLEVLSAVRDDMALLIEQQRGAPAVASLRLEHSETQEDRDLQRILDIPGAGLFAGPFLHEIIRLCRGRRLVILDPLALLAGALDTNDNGRMSALMRVLTRIASVTGCAILLLHHIGKGNGEGKDDWEKARGASALTTSVRLQLNLSTPTLAESEEYGIEKDDRDLYVRVAQVKANYAAPAEDRLLRKDKGGVLRAWDFARESLKDKEGDKKRSGNAYKAAKDGQRAATFAGVSDDWE